MMKITCPAVSALFSASAPGANPTAPASASSWTAARRRFHSVLEDIQHELNRRRPGQSKIVTPRKEDDTAEILSGVLDGQTLGTPIGIFVRNTDQRPSAYTEMQQAYRPSHADYTYDAKYGIRAVSGGGRSSARETIGRVAAGAIARKVLQHSLSGYECARLRQNGAAHPRAGAHRLCAELRGHRIQHRPHLRSCSGGKNDRAHRKHPP
jgi:hypothetical protein